MSSDADFQRVSAAWREAARELGIKVVAPYSLSPEQSAAAFLPHFGSSRGMVVGVIRGPDCQTDLLGWAKEKGVYFSFVNSKVYEKFDREVFLEALIDWGYFGDPAEKPSWMSSDRVV